MKEELHKLIDELEEHQVIYSLIFLTKMFKKRGVEA